MNASKGTSAWLVAGYTVLRNTAPTSLRSILWKRLSRR